MSAQSANKSSSKSSAPKEIISGETFNPDKDIKYSKPKVNASGGKSVGILNSTTNGATYVSTPLMMTWGVSAFEDKKTGEKSYSMSLQFPGEEYNTPAITKFRANIVKFEQKIKADALANQKEWFGKSTMTKDHIDMFWTPILKFAKGEIPTTKNKSMMIVTTRHLLSPLLLLPHLHLPLHLLLLLHPMSRVPAVASRRLSRRL